MLVIFKKTDGTYAVRLDPGEEIIASLKKLCERENIAFAEVSAIGAVDRAVVGLYNLTERKYHSKTFEEPLELVSLLGNVSRRDGEVYIHLHASFADEQCRTVGGHLNEAVISGTCEMFVKPLDGEMNRRVCEKTGLNIFDI